MVIPMQLQEYLQELNKIELLGRAEELALWQAYKDSGDARARKKLIEAYQPLVFKVASPFRQQENIMDILQEGTVGLIEAVENFDYQRGVAFSIYASYRIRGRMQDFLQQEGMADIACLDYGNDNYRLEMIADTGAAVAEVAEYHEIAGKLMDAMDRLPDKEQQVLDQMYLKCQEAKEVAENLQVSTAHIYRLQKSGVRRVRGMLSKFMHGWK